MTTLAIAVHFISCIFSILIEFLAPCQEKKRKILSLEYHWAKICYTHYQPWQGSVKFIGTWQFKCFELLITVSVDLQWKNETIWRDVSFFVFFDMTDDQSDGMEMVC